MAFYSNQPKSLDQILRDYLKKMPRRKELKRGMALHLWPQVVGDRVARATQDLRFEGSRLIVKVENDAWRHEVHMNRHTIRQALNSRVGGNLIKELVVRC